MRSQDQETITGFLADQREAVGTIERWIHQAAFPFRRRLAEEWEDAVQDVLVEVTRLLRQGSFRGEASLKTYLWRVASNACVDKLRNRGRVQQLPWEDLQESDERTPQPLATVPSPTEAEAKDLRLRVLAEMSEDCRQLWRMIVEGLSYRQMSERLGVAEGALRVRVLRCRKRAVAARDELLSIGAKTDVTSQQRTGPNRAGR